MAIAALANCSSRTSRWDRYTVCAGSVTPSGRCRTNTRSWPTRVSRPASAGAVSAATSSVTNRPVASSSPAFTSSATASTSPEPHRPAGATSPITCSSTSSSTRTTSIAPSAARMPHRIAPPSKAGPAGAAVARIWRPSESTISQFVPTSMNSRSRLSRSMPVASIPATMSPPTYAPRAGKSSARPRGCTGTPRSLASTTGGVEHDITNGATPNGSGSMPRTSAVIVALPATATSYTSAGSTSASAQTPAVRLGQGRVRGRAEPVEGVGVEHRGADPRDHVAAEGLLPVEHRVHGQRGAGAEVEEGGHHGRGAEVEGDRETAVGGVTRLDVDEGLVHDDRGHPVVARTQDRRQPAEGVQVRLRVEVVDRVEQPGEVRPLVGQGRLRQARRTGFCTAGRRITCRPTPTVAALGRVVSGGHLDAEVLRGLGETGQPPPPHAATRD